MNKYMVLSFSNAKLFRGKEKATDKKIDLLSGDGNNKCYGIKREVSDMFVEPIAPNHVSNVLHTLFGERPVPSLRKCLYNRVDYYHQKAMDSYLKIDSPMASKEDGTKYYIGELMQTQKLAWDSFVAFKRDKEKANWELIRKHIGSQEHFDEFVDRARKIIKEEPLHMCFVDAAHLLNESWKKTKGKGLVNDLLEFLVSIGRTPVKHYITGETNPTFYKGLGRDALTICRGIETNVKILRGSIIVPVSDDDIERLKQYSKGHATILDGGLVKIESIVHKNFLEMDDDYRKVSDISSEKVKVETK